MPRYVGQYELGHLLGSGGFGKVYYGRDSKTSEGVAVKIIDKQLIKAHQMEEYVDREIAIMRRLEHPHVIKLKNVVELPSSFCLIMELANNGELFDKIIEARRFDEATARSYFQQLISAVAYCHQKGVVHRDLKAENLLLGEGSSLKVCDFGLSRYTLRNGTPDHNLLFMSVAGSPDYQAPEVSSSDNGYHGEACDVWSCGAILYFMLTGTLPFTGRDDDETYARVSSGTYDRNNHHLTPEAADLISRILTVDPEKRIAVWQIVEHPWFIRDLDPALFPDAPRDRPQASPVNPNSAGFVVSAKDSYCGDSIVVKLHRAFHSCNVDHSGHLKRPEVRDVLIALNNGSPVSEEEVLGVMECFKVDADGTISEEEFVQGWSNAETRLGNRLPLDRLVNIFHYDLEKTLVEDLRSAFDRLDLSHDGLLTAENVAKIQELNLTEEEAKQLILSMDTRKRGSVTFEDFVSAVTSADLVRNALGAKLQRIRELFNAVDRAAFSSYLNTGFTVAGFRDQILQKLLEKGPTSELNTNFEPGEAGFLLGALKDPQTGRTSQMGVQLLPATPGYTRVLAYRIAGKTEVFHSWFRNFRGLLHEEIVRFAEDTSVKGDSELL